MPASKHMIVIEKRRDIELRVLMAGAASENAHGGQPRKAARQRRATPPPGATSATIREQKI